MATVRSEWLSWLTSLAIVAILGSALWFAWHRGWLTFNRGSAMSDHAGMGMGGMGGMGMGGRPSVKMGDSGTSTGVPDHAEVTLGSEIQQRIGVQTGKVEQGPLRMSVQTVGIVRPNETKVARIHLKTEGWVEKLTVNYTGQVVQKGQPLLAIYSPQFMTTQQDYLNALEAARGRGENKSLAELARQRLELWDVPDDTIKKLEQTGKPQKDLTLLSPLTGTVLEMNVREKEYITPEKELYVIADLSTVWVQAKVYQSELLHVELGQPATAAFPEIWERPFSGKVVFIQPTVEEATRTVQVRVELPNQQGLLKPGMFAHVEITHPMGEGLLIPISAVVRTGERDIAFRVQSADRFLPVEVKISPIKFGDRFQVLEGLKAGDRIVTSANFLLDSESQLRAGGGGMPGMAGMGMGDMKGMKKGGVEGSDSRR